MSEFTEQDVAQAKELLTSESVDHAEMGDAEIVAKAIEMLGGDPVSPGESAKEEVPPGDTVADFKKSLAEGDAKAVLKAFEQINAEREKDKKVVEAIGASLSDIITKNVLSDMKDDYPEVTTKKGMKAIQAKAGALLATGQYSVEEAVSDAAHLVYGKTGKKSTVETGEKSGLDRLRELKSQGSPSTTTLRKAPAAQTYDEWADQIGKMVVDGRYEEAKVLRERGFSKP
jgi:hypothetical protein